MVRVEFFAEEDPHKLFDSAFTIISKLLLASEPLIEFATSFCSHSTLVVPILRKDEP